MSSNVNAVPGAMLMARTGASVVDLASLLSGNGGAPDGQHFANWMSQHQETPLAPVAQFSSAPENGPPAQAALPHPSTVAKAAAPMAPAPAPATPAPASHAAASDASEAAAEQRPAEPADALPQQSGAAAKPLARATAKPTAKAGSLAPAEGVGQEATPRTGHDAGAKTGPGEVGTWVRELQPPPGLTAADPAAMLAWLASLTQAEAPATGRPDAAVLDGEASRGRPDAPAGGARGQDVLAGGGTALALGAKDIPLVSAMTLAAEGGSARGSPGQRDANSGTVDFSALMSGEIGRAQQAGDGPAVARHFTGALAAPVASPQFAQALADRVGMWISGPALGGPMTAELRLNPAEMGPVHIRIELDGQKAMVDFSAANAETRDAIEASLPMLSGALETVGLSLSGGGVSDQGAGQAWSGQREQARSAPWMAQAEQGGVSAVSELQIDRSERLGHQRAGGLDLYA